MSKLVEFRLCSSCWFSRQAIAKGPCCLALWSVARLCFPVLFWLCDLVRLLCAVMAVALCCCCLVAFVPWSCVVVVWWPLLCCLVLTRGCLPWPVTWLCFVPLVVLLCDGVELFTSIWFAGALLWFLEIKGLLCKITLSCVNKFKVEGPLCKSEILV